MFFIFKNSVMIYLTVQTINMIFFTEFYLFYFFQFIFNCENLQQFVGYAEFDSFVILLNLIIHIVIY